MTSWYRLKVITANTCNVTASPQCNDSNTFCAAIEMHSTAYTVLHCTLLYCTLLHCTITALNCNKYYVLYCTALHQHIMLCTALHCTALHCTTLHCTSLHCTAPMEGFPPESPFVTGGGSSENSPRETGSVYLRL